MFQSLTRDWERDEGLGLTREDGKETAREKERSSALDRLSIRRMFTPPLVNASPASQDSINILSRCIFARPDDDENSESSDGNHEEGCSSFLAGSASTPYDSFPIQILIPGTVTCPIWSMQRDSADHCRPRSGVFNDVPGSLMFTTPSDTTTVILSQLQPSMTVGTGNRRGSGARSYTY
ncbi:hypothetical protein JB92DRAFT_2839297 [Gautieria morchelliformis]|nr:hypothetical protein JB92DRAFT_2839297 [Gautieria morchelliformis]